MEFFETVEKRNSIRAFVPADLSTEKLHRLLHAANLAPSAGNLQSYRIVVVKDKEVKKALSHAANHQEFIVLAPVLLVFIADRQRAAKKYGARGSEFFSIQDATIAASYCQLAATALGLGSVWIGGFDTRMVCKLMKCSRHEYPVAIIPVGHPGEGFEGHERRSLKNLVSQI